MTVALHPEETSAVLNSLPRSRRSGSNTCAGRWALETTRCLRLHADLLLLELLFTSLRSHPLAEFQTNCIVNAPVRRRPSDSDQQASAIAEALILTPSFHLEGKTSMGASNKQVIEELRAIIGAQQELLRTTLWVMSHGPADFFGHKVSCVLRCDQVRAATATSLGAGQSVGTILAGSANVGIPVRDLYPITRAVVEGFINASFFVTQPVEVSERAMKHKDYAAWKHINRSIGNGDFAFRLSSDPDPKATAAKLFPEFTGKGQDSWSSLDAPSKINRIGKVDGRSGGALLGAYALVYAVSSEIIHGSVYGMSYFMSAHNQVEQSVEAFQGGTEAQVVDILTAVIHATSGFLSAFATVHDCKPLADIERDLFCRMYKAVSGEDLDGRSGRPLSVDKKDS